MNCEIEDEIDDEEQRTPMKRRGKSYVTRPASPPAKVTYPFYATRSIAP